MALCYSYLAVHISSSCGRSPALLVSVSIASIDGDCGVSNDCCSLGRLELVGYCVQGNLGVINKGIINMINAIKGNDNNMYNLYHIIEGIMHYILCHKAAFLAHLQPK